jgi:hypothetical protein
MRVSLACGLFVALLAGGAGAMAQQAAPAPAEKPAPAPPPPPASRETIYVGEATSILGRPVTGPDEQMVGRVVDVLVDDFGQPRAAVLDVGGFMGLGSRKVAVAWRALHFTSNPSGHGTITLEMTADQIKAMPEYKPAGKPVTVAAPPKPADPAPH